MTFDNNYYNKNLKAYARELRTETVSKAEKILWKAILSRKQTGQRFLRQRPIDKFIVDFLCPDLRLIIEIDGNSHYRKPDYDAWRQDQLIKLGYTFLRFSEGAVIHDLNDVSKQIEHAIHTLRGEVL